jgi:hypothetical protein
MHRRVVVKVLVLQLVMMRAKNLQLAEYQLRGKATLPDPLKAVAHRLQRVHHHL